MTKADLVEHVAEAAGLSKAEAEEVVNTVLDSIVRALETGDKVELRGFGSFRLRMRRPRQGRNPKTGTTVQVPGKAVPYFKPGKELREMLNPDEAHHGLTEAAEAGSEAESAEPASEAGSPHGGSSS